MHWSEKPISWSRADHPEVLPSPGSYALVLDATVMPRIQLSIFVTPTLAFSGDAICYFLRGWGFVILFCFVPLFVAYAMLIIFIALPLVILHASHIPFGNRHVVAMFILCIALYICCVLP